MVEAAKFLGQKFSEMAPRINIKKSKMKMPKKYKPLPDSVFIRKSSIHGYGLFARTPIKSGQHLGMSHIFAPGFSKDSYIRTPLGGFINHSDTPNCKKEESPEESAITYYTLVTIADIPADTELTLSYTLYEIDDYRNVTVIGAI